MRRTTRLRAHRANAASIAALCVRLDGLPLALELAAARVALLSPRAILERVGRWLDLLKRSQPDVPERHRTLPAAIEWSYELLCPEEQALFWSLGVFVGGFTIDGAEAVASGAGIDAIDGVDSLLRASLLRAEGAAGDEPRFGMLETIHEYALDRLGQREQSAELRDGHARFYLALAERAELEARGPDQLRWLELLEADNDNLRRAVAWFAERGNLDGALRLGAALWRFWQVRGHLDEGRQQLERLLARREGSPAARALAQLTVGRCAWLQGDFEAAERSLATSLPVHRKLGDAYSVAFALTVLGAAKGTQGDDEQAQALLGEALAVARAAGNEWCASMALAYTGAWLLGKGELAAARHTLEESLRGMRECGDARMACVTLAILARVALANDEREQARARLRQALPLLPSSETFGGLPRCWRCSPRLRWMRGTCSKRLRGYRRLCDLPRMHRPAGDRVRTGIVRPPGREARDTARAARLYACASILADRVTAYPLRARRPVFTTQVAELQRSLGEEAFAQAWGRVGR